MAISVIGLLSKNLSQHSQNRGTKMAKDKETEDIIYNLSNRIARSAIAVVDTVSQRGGFKGEELSTIGQLRDQCVQVVSICEDKAQQDSE